MKKARIKSSMLVAYQTWKVIWFDPEGFEHITAVGFTASKEEAERKTIEAANEYLNPKPIRSKKVRMISPMINEANN